MAAKIENADQSYETVAAANLRNNAPEIVGRVAYTAEPVILTRFGKPQAALIPLGMLALISKTEDRIDVLAARRARGDVKKNGTITLAQLKADLAI